jgi:two-component system nitrogen regulation sensor histidine kinase NtrY
VKKIIEEHGGTLVLEDAEPFEAGAHAGAMAVVSLPLLMQDAVEAELAG